MRVLILANGDPPSKTLAHALAAEHDLLIATDGAVHKAEALELVPDIVSGDFDSINLSAARSAFPNTEFVETSDQNLADLEKALLLAKTRGVTHITIAGGSGGRVDHTLTTYALLFRYHNEISMCLRHDGCGIYAVSANHGEPGARSIPTWPGDTVSVITFDSENRLSLSGVQWPMDDTPLLAGTHGVSNIATGSRVNVSVMQGRVLLCHLYQRYLPEK